MGQFDVPPSLVENFKARTALAAEYRGRILNKFADIEFLIEMVISHYFCDNDLKANEIRHSLICTKYLTFDAKSVLIGFIIKHHYKEFGEKFPKLEKSLVEYRDLRNIVAHRKLLNTDEKILAFNGDDISFENFETKSKEIEIKDEPFNEKIVVDWENKMVVTVIMLDELLHLVNSKVA